MSAQATKAGQRDDLVSPLVSFTSEIPVSTSDMKLSSEHHQSQIAKPEVQVMGFTCNGAASQSLMRDSTQHSPIYLTSLSGAQFGEHCILEHYAASIDTTTSVPIPRYWHQGDHHPAREYHSDDEDWAYNDASALDMADSPAARSASLTSDVRLWQGQVEDWKVTCPARSVGHAKRRRRNKAQQAIKKCEAVLKAKSTGNSARETNEVQEA